MGTAAPMTSRESRFPLKASELGEDGTAEQLCVILVELFRVARSPDAVNIDEPIFSAGVGLSSMDGMELLCEIERRFDVRIDRPDEWMDDSPTIASVARYLVDHSRSAR